MSLRLLWQPSRELGVAGPVAGKDQAVAAAEQRAGEAGQALWGRVGQSWQGCHGPGELHREGRRAAPAPVAAATVVTWPWRVAPAARAPGLQLPEQTECVQAWAATQRELLAHTTAPPHVGSAPMWQGSKVTRVHEERTQTLQCDWVWVLSVTTTEIKLPLKSLNKS